MPAADTAKLLASLELQDKFTPTAAKISKSIGGMESKFSKLGNTAKIGLGNLANNLARVGALAVAGLGAAVFSGLKTLEERESLLATTTNAIKNAGLAGKVAAPDVAAFAQSLESAIGNAYDYAEIQAAANRMLYFGNVTGLGFERATTAAVNLGGAMKTGPEEGAKMLAKALADPVKGMTALRRAGIVLDATQQANIKTLMKSNDLTKAQGVLLGYVEEKTKGAALASQGKYAQALAKLSDAARDAKAALAEGFLPVITKVADFLSKKLGDKGTMDSIRELGVSLAGAFDKALTFAEQIPWDSVRDAMSMMGKGAKAAFDLFTGLPPWVQTAVITGWGLNKLTGGALSSIIGQLGSGLIKGVLGMSAGVVNINAGAVTGAGGVGGAVPGGAVGTGSKILGAVKILGSVAIAGASIAALAQAFGDFMGGTKDAQTALDNVVTEAKKQTAAQTVANLNATIAQQDSAMIWDKIIAETWGGAQLTQNLTDAANRLATAGLTGRAAEEAASAVRNAIRYADYAGFTSAIGPLTDALKTLEASFKPTMLTARIAEAIRGAITGAITPPKPILTARADDPRYATGAARVGRMREQGDPLLPAFQGIFDRAWAKGKVPTETALQGTYLRNIQRGIDAQRISAAIAATSTRMLAVAQAVGAASIVAAIRTIAAPVVNVTTSVSVRDTVFSTKKFISYGGARKANG